MKNPILKFFDHLEDRIRIGLSHNPILYGLIGRIALVLFWRGVWLTADLLKLSGPASMFIGAVILLATGLLVSVFIGDQIIISGVREEKKITEKTEEELKTEIELFLDLRHKIEKIQRRIEHMEKGNGKSK